MQKKWLQRDINKKGERINYDTYQMNAKEILLYGFQGVMLITIFGFFFYRSIFITLCFVPFTVFYIFRKRKYLSAKRKLNLNIQFKEALNSVHASLQAGYSIENAFFEAYRDMVMFYGQNSLIADELAYIKKGIRNNRTLEEMIMDLGRRSGVDDIRDFASVLIIGKQSGGNINEVIESSILVVEEKVALMQEIDTMISSRRFEQKIMNAIPFLIILYIELTSKGFFSILYESFFGRIVMSICLIIYLFSLFLSSKIMNITI